MTQDRTYTSSEHYIFQMCGVESWTELWEKAPEIQPMKTLMAEGLVSIISLRNRMIKERLALANNVSEESKKLSKELGLSEATIRVYIYR